jgi:uncharacterized damage-inducible protein DinB
MERAGSGDVRPGLETFYGLVRRTRARVLDWLQELSPAVVARHDDRFAFGSLGAIHAHVAETYLKWVGTVGLGRAVVEVGARDVPGLREAFADVDAAVAEALAGFTDWDAPFPWVQPDGTELSVTRRWLILHPITHEFHHKGQALALARVLGHPHHGTPDTDLIEP